MIANCINGEDWNMSNKFLVFGLNLGSLQMDL